MPDFPAGARDERSTYLHLVVCPLELAALTEVIGAERAEAAVRLAPVYTWIYQHVLASPGWFDALLARHGLVPPG